MPLASGVIKRPAGWPAYMRIRHMMQEVDALFDEYASLIDRVVVEIPGRAQAGRKRAKFATPGVYGAAVGAVLAVCWANTVDTKPVVTVDSDHWTRINGGRGEQKSARLQTLALLTGRTGEGDAGGDEGDAISLGQWYLSRHSSSIPDWIDLHLPPKNLGKNPYSPTFARAVAFRYANAQPRRS